MQTLAKTMIAVGFIGAAAAIAPAPASAQGVYVDGPGITFGVGRPYYGHRYYRDYYDGPYAWRHHRYDRRYSYRWGDRWRDWD